VVPALVADWLVPAWRIAPSGACVLGDGVDVWRIPLDSREAEVAALRRVVSADERARAERFHDEALRRRFVVRRGRLRGVLARYLGVAPEEIVIGASRRGRPSVSSPPAPRVDFSLADSGDLALIAVAREGPVGIDVERLREVPDAEAIARRWFPAAERDVVLAAEGEARTRAFLVAWTRLEARWKASGVGLAAMWGDEKASRDADAGETSSFSPHEGCVAALAAPRGVRPPRWYEWPS
jgi:4'-phosphopantetheinyl transferase